MGLEWKHLGLTIYFPSSSSNQTHSKKVLFPIFSQKFSIHPISPPNKHTLKVYGYIPSFPVVLIVQLYHKTALAKNLYEPKKNFVNQIVMNGKNKFSDYQNLRFTIAYVPFQLCWFVQFYHKKTSEKSAWTENKFNE